MCRPDIALAFYLRKIDEAVSTALATHPDATQIVLVAHSIGMLMSCLFNILV